MEYFVVLYRDDSLTPADQPLAFSCQADDVDHAEEQCLNMYPDLIEIVWVVDTDDVDLAYKDYYGEEDGS